MDELIAPLSGRGEIRRLTIFCTDLVDSTRLSTRIDPETYSAIVGRYRSDVERIVAAHGGHVAATKGDGLLVLFGHPVAHENDAHRAIRSGMEIVDAVAALNDRARRTFGVGVNVRVGVHRGSVYLDTDQDDVYGLAANLAARLCGLAAPGTVVVSDAIHDVVRGAFEFEPLPAAIVPGVPDPVEYYRAVAVTDSWRTSVGPLIGRDDVLELLETTWATTLSAESRGAAGIALVGEAGIGKTRLAASAAELAERNGATTLELIGSPFHTGVGLHPVRRLLERQCRIPQAAYPAERLRMLAEELVDRGMDSRTMTPLLAPVLGVSPEAGYRPVALDGRKLHDQIAGAVCDYLTACIGVRPTLVLIEDMHWFDSSTLDIVRSLLGSPLVHTLAVMTSRDKSTVPVGGNTQIVTLTTLSDHDAAELITTLDSGLSATSRAAVMRRCDGVPLYIEEVVNKLGTQSDRSAAPAQVPDSLYEALLARLPSDDATLAVVETAAMIGSHVDGRLLRAASTQPENEVDLAIEKLIAGLVLSRIDDDNWRFRHELLREVAAELPPPSVRRALHGRIADALVSLTSTGQPDWPLIGVHFEQADRFEEAASAYQKASAAARGRGALDEAREHLSRALDATALMPQGAVRDGRELSLRLRRGFLASAALGANNSDTATDFERCLQLGGSDLSNDDLFATQMATFTHFFSRGEMRRAEQVVQTLRVAVDNGREWWKAENIGGRGALLWMRGDFEAARDTLEESVELMAAREQRDLESAWFMPFDPVVSTHTHLALARWVLGDTAGTSPALADAWGRVDQLEFPQGPFSACFIDYIDCVRALDSWDPQQAAQSAASMTERAVRHGLDASLAAGSVMQASAAAVLAASAQPIDTAAVDALLPTLEGWSDICRVLEVKSWLISHDAVVARLLIALGRADEARRRIDAALSLGDETLMHYCDSELLRLRAQTHEDEDSQRTDLTAALTLARKQHATIYELRSAMDLFRAQGDHARDALSEAISHFPAGSTWPELATARAALG